MTDLARPWQLVRTETFLRALRKYLKKHPDREGAVRNVLTLLSEDPQTPSLRLHSLSGNLKGLRAVRVTYGDRIILMIALREHQVILLDIGGHDAVYR